MLIEKILDKVNIILFLLSLLLSVALTIIEVYILQNINNNEIMGLIIFNFILLIFIFSVVDKYFKKGKQDENK